MRKRKALKKGGFNNPVRAGPTIPEQLSKYDKKNIEGLKDTYELNFKRAESDLNRQENIRKEAITTFMKQKQIEETQAKNNSAVDKNRWIKIRDTASGAKNILFGLIAMVKYIITFVITNVKYIITTIGTAGKGAIIKAVLAILFIVLVILGATGVLYNINGKTSTIKETNDVGQSILTAENNTYLTMPENDKNIFSKMYDSINNLIPSEYKYKMNYISNSVTYITTGKNQYDVYLKDRDEITNGRSDNIFHINLDKLKDKTTFSIIEPKDIELNFNENLYYNSDYNKIDSTVRNNMNYPNKCIIKVKPNSLSGKYILNIENILDIKYKNNNGIIANSNLIKPIFKYADTSNLNLGVKFNNFNNYLYTGYFDANNMVGAYATTLINPNYKGPILRLTNANNAEISTVNENKNGKRTANFYNDYKDVQLYTIIDDKKVYYNEFFTKQASSVAILYDQSGNNNHLKYENYTFVHMPEFYKDSDNKYALWFYEQHMLVFTKPISYKKIKIYTKILFNEILEYTKADTTDSTLIGTLKFEQMNFLSTKSDKVIQLSIDNNVDLVFTTTRDMDNDDNNIKQISKHFTITEINKRWTAKKDPFVISTEFIYNKNTDPIVLECLGNAYDTRAAYEKTNRDSINGENIRTYLKKHSFKGYLYDLRIFKSNED